MWTNENTGDTSGAFALPERPDRQGMGVCGTAHSAGKARRQRADGEHARSVNAVMYVLSTGCQWRAIPKDLPPRSTVYDYFDLWGWDGTLDRLHDALYLRVAGRPRAKRAPPPPSSTARASRAQKKGGLHRSAGLRCRKENQGQEAAPSGRHPRAADAGDRPFRRRPGPRRRRSADVEALRRFPFLVKLFADAGYQGPKFPSAMKDSGARQGRDRQTIRSG